MLSITERFCFALLTCKTMPACRTCGEPTNKRHAFGESICDPCYEYEDRAIENYERRQADRYGYDQDYYRALDKARAEVSNGRD